jgi:hypothetical protein
VPVDASGPPSAAGSGVLDGAYFVGSDTRQLAACWCTIAVQALDVVARICGVPRRSLCVVVRAMSRRPAPTSTGVCQAGRSARDRTGSEESVVDGAAGGALAVAYPCGEKFRL